MINVAELMDDPDFVQPFVIKRPKVAMAADGSASTTYTEIDAIGVVQPAKPSEVKSLPEGIRVDDLISVWSRTGLYGSDGKRTESDVLVIEGKSYRVVSEENRPGNGYYRIFATGFAP